MKIIKISLILILILFASSCATKMKISEKKLEKIEPNFSGYFYNTSYKRLDKKGTIKKQSSILNAVWLEQEDVQVIYMEIGKNEVLNISFFDSYTNKMQTATFKGKFKRGFYELYLVKKSIKIPPIIPVIYGIVDIDRVRIGKSKNGDLIIEKYIDRGGCILFFCAGGTWTHQNFHQPVPQ